MIFPSSREKEHASVWGPTIKTSLCFQVQILLGLFFQVSLFAHQDGSTQRGFSTLSHTEPGKSRFSLSAYKEQVTRLLSFFPLTDTVSRWFPITALHVYSSKLFNLFCVGQINFYSNSAAAPSTAYTLAGTDEFCYATSSLVFFSICTELLFR